jgi:Zn-dependent protease
MRFRLFGVEIQVQIAFWITVVLLGVRQTMPGSFAPGAGPFDLDVPQGAAVVVWVAVVFASVLLHELGHAFALRRRGVVPAITLHALGGITTHRSLVPLGRLDSIVVSLAGPFAGFLLGGAVLLGARLFPRGLDHVPPAGVFALESVVWVNLGWGVVNLVPVQPLDGGHVLEQALGPGRRRIAAAVSTLVGLLMAALFLSKRAILGALVFGLAAVQSYRRFTAEAEERPTP